MSAQDSMEQMTLNRNEMAECLRNTVERGQELSLIVTGYSMSPTLKHMIDRVLLISAEDFGIRRLDIILFRRPNGKYVLHRILKCKSDGLYIVNGDAQLWTEEVRKEQILAVVRKIVKTGKTIDCQSAGYRLYAAVWVGIKPFRGLITGIYRRFRKGREGT